MGKKARSKQGQLKAKNRKVEPGEVPAPPPIQEDEMGSAKLLDRPRVPGTTHHALDQDGYDDGGVADLMLVIDLDDFAMRRKRGDADYFAALKSDRLPRITKGSLAGMTRRDQKVKLARILFSEGEEEEEDHEGIVKNPSEVYVDNVDGKEDEETQYARLESLNVAKQALRLSTVLQEPACASLALVEISKRYLDCFGKAGGEDALRCADKAIEIASEGFYDNDEVAMEAEDEPQALLAKHVKDPTKPGLQHPTTLKLKPARAAVLCLRSARLHRGNALAALGREDEARATYAAVLPSLVPEPRTGRLDWERSSLHVNIGNTHSRQGNYAPASACYAVVEKMGDEHVERGGKVDGLGIKILGMRARAFALKKDGQEEEGKKLLRQVLELQLELNKEEEIEKEKLKKLKQEQESEMAAAAAAAAAASQAQQEDAAIEDAESSDPVAVQ